MFSNYVPIQERLERQVVRAAKQPTTELANFDFPTNKRNLELRVVPDLPAEAPLARSPLREGPWMNTAWYGSPRDSALALIDAEFDRKISEIVARDQSKAVSEVTAGQAQPEQQAAQSQTTPGRLSRIFDMRGYAIFGGMAASLVLNGAAVVCLDLALIGGIIAVSKDGPKLLGHMGRLFSKSEFLKSPAGTALLMALPVKTITVFLGAASPEMLAGIAHSTTIGLFGLALGLSLWGVVEKAIKAIPVRMTNFANKYQKLMNLVDVAVLGLVFALGKDGVAVFGKGAEWLQDNLPFANSAWGRGFLAVLPIKTSAALALAGDSERREQIASKGAGNMAVLSAFSYTVYLAATSGFTAYAALPLGIATAAICWYGLKRYSQV